MTTGKQGRNYKGDAGGTGGYINYDGDRECSISNHHQQSSRGIIRIIRYRSEYGLFFPWTIYVACSKVGKPVKLFIYTDNGTSKNFVYSQALTSSEPILCVCSQVNYRS